MKTISLLTAVLCAGLVLTSGIFGRQQQDNRQSTSKTKRKTTTAKGDIQYISSERNTSQNLPFSEAVRVGKMLYISGNIGTVPGTLDLAPGGIEPETKQALENIGQILKANGSSFSRVVKCTVMMADMKEWPDMNKVYVTYFPKGHLPARSAFGTSGLARGARVEIECTAVVK
ncbi:MAG TPA: RidA family protein [Blastocatellia bacterium]|nr:RidA family protein [Blastocatellia bacterium]